MKYASDSHIINMEEIVESWKEQGMNYQETANEILSHIGGAETIREMTHCFTCKSIHDYPMKSHVLVGEVLH